MDGDYRLFGSIVVTFFAIAIALAVIGQLKPSWLLAEATKRTAQPGEMAVASASISTPALQTTPVPAQTRGQTPRSAATVAVGATLSVAAKNTAFDKTALAAKSGSVSIEFDNQDAGVAHNFHLVSGGDASAASIGMTPITSGPDSETLTVTLAAGRYLYHCDVHPTQMTGQLTVN